MRYARGYCASWWESRQCATEEPSLPHSSSSSGELDECYSAASSQDDVYSYSGSDPSSRSTAGTLEL